MNILNWFKGPTPVDTSSDIYSPNGDRYSLLCDHEILKEELDWIHVHLKDWIIKDLGTSSDVGVEFKRSLTGVFTNLNLKLLPLPEVVEILDNIAFNANEQYARSYARWQDAIVLINMHCDPAVLEALRNRFLDAMLYAVGNVQGVVIRKEDWFALIADYPWLYLLPYVQSLVENDPEIAAIVNGPAE